MISKKEFINVFKSGAKAAPVSLCFIDRNLNFERTIFETGIGLVALFHNNRNVRLTAKEKSYLIEHLEFFIESFVIDGITKRFSWWILDENTFYDEELIYTLGISKETLMYHKLKLGFTGASVSELKELVCAW